MPQTNTETNEQTVSETNKKTHETEMSAQEESDNNEYFKKKKRKKKLETDVYLDDTASLEDPAATIANALDTFAKNKDEEIRKSGEENFQGAWFKKHAEREIPLGPRIGAYFTFSRLFVAGVILYFGGSLLLTLGGTFGLISTAGLFTLPLILTVGAIAAAVIIPTLVVTLRNKAPKAPIEQKDWYKDQEDLLKEAQLKKIINDFKADCAELLPSKDIKKIRNLIKQLEKIEKDFLKQYKNPNILAKKLSEASQYANDIKALIDSNKQIKDEMVKLRDEINKLPDNTKAEKADKEKLLKELHTLLDTLEKDGLVNEYKETVKGFHALYDKLKTTSGKQSDSTSSVLSSLSSNVPSVENNPTQQPPTLSTKNTASTDMNLMASKRVLNPDDTEYDINSEESDLDSDTDYESDGKKPFLG